MAEKEKNISVNGAKELCQSAFDLQKNLKQIAETVLNNVSEDKFVQIYKKCYKEFEKKSDINQPLLGGSSSEARKYRQQFNSMLIKSIFLSVDGAVSNINNNLKELEELKCEQGNSTIFWRPPGNAAEHIIPFEYISESEKKLELEGKIKIEEEALEALKSRLLQKRIKAEELHKILLSSIDKINIILTNSPDD